MKRLLLCLLVLQACAMGNIISVVTDGVGSFGNAGTAGDPLFIGETISIKIVLNDNPVVGTDDGYALSMFDLVLVMSGPATLDAGSLAFDAAITGNVEDDTPADGIIDQISGICFTQVVGATDLVLNLTVTVTDDSGPVLVDISIGNLTQAADYGEAGFPEANWYDLIDGDLDDLTLYTVPEPMSMVLLVLGSSVLFVRKRR
jgi:hypothetical protein